MLRVDDGMVMPWTSRIAATMTTCPYTMDLMMMLLLWVAVLLLERKENWHLIFSHSNFFVGRGRMVIFGGTR